MNNWELNCDGMKSLIVVLPVVTRLATTAVGWLLIVAIIVATVWGFFVIICIGTIRGLWYVVEGPVRTAGVPAAATRLFTKYPWNNVTKVQFWFGYSAMTSFTDPVIMLSRFCKIGSIFSYLKRPTKIYFSPTTPRTRSKKVFSRTTKNTKAFSCLKQSDRIECNLYKIM